MIKVTRKENIVSAALYTDEVLENRFTVSCKNINTAKFLVQMLKANIDNGKGFVAIRYLMALNGSQI